MSQRGMKKWAPYKSLKEQWQVLDEQKSHINDVEKPQISNEEADQINNILVNYHGQILKIKYYRYHRYNIVTTTLKKIDTINRQLILTDSTKIKFNEIFQIEEI